MVEKAIHIRINEGKSLTPSIGGQLIEPHDNTKDALAAKLYAPYESP